MKKFLAFFVIVFGFYGTLSALTSDERFAVVKEKYPNAEKFTPNSKSDFVYVESTQLKNQKTALETFSKEKPDTILIIDFTKGDDFVNETGTITLGKGSFPTSLKNLVISNTQKDITRIGDSFLSWYSGLQTIDLSGLSGVTSIGGGFLSWCSGLQTIDLSGLSGVTSIGNDFLYRCKGLQTIDLSGLSGVTSIGNGFLYLCKSLQNIIGLDDGFIERLNEASRINVIKFLRESNMPALQALGQDKGNKKSPAGLFVG